MKLKESLRLDRLKYGLAGTAISTSSGTKTSPSADRNDSPSSSSSGSEVFSKQHRASVSSGLDNLFSDFISSGGSNKSSKDTNSKDKAIRPKGLVSDVECASSKESTPDSVESSSLSKQPKNAQTITGMLRGAFGLFNHEKTYSFS